MKVFILLLTLTSLSLALDITIKVAKENFENYSTLHLKNSEPFTCNDKKDNFDNVITIICSFDKKPAKRFKPIKNNFFKVISIIKESRYYLKITPYQKMRLFAMDTNLINEESSFEVKVNSTRHWMIVGYTNSIPFINSPKRSNSAINFPINITRDKLPYVGALDLHSKPVEVSNIADVSDYLALKKLYKIKNYEQVLELCNEIIENYPNSIFMSEVMIYKIRSLHYLEEPEDLIELSKVFMREYSSSSAMAEILAYTANAYAKIGLYIDADYFFDRVFDEHDDSKYSRLALIFKAQQLYDAGNAKKAIQYYKKALYTTKDMDIAAFAAFKIAEYEIEHKRVKVAAEYIAKIAQKKSEYFFEKRVDSLKMAEDMFDLAQYESSYIILKNIYEHIAKSDDENEKILKDIIVALSKTDKVDLTLDYINTYNKNFKMGDYEEQVEIAKDSLFFDKKDLNITAKLQEYNTLIDKYSNDKIGEKALYKKAKLLFANGMYKPLLDLNTSLFEITSKEFSDIDSMLSQSAQKLLQIKLKNNACSEALKIYVTYSLAPLEDEKIYSCALRVNNFVLAKAIAKNYLHVKALDARAKWLYNYIVALYKLGEYSEMLLASDDLLALENRTTNSEIYRYRFDAYKALEKNSELITAIAMLEAKFGLDAKDIERYSYMIVIAQKKSDDVMVENFATKVIQIQKRANIHSQTPFVEFSLVQSLQKLNKLDKAIGVLKSLLAQKVDTPTQARASYLLGSIYLKESNTAKAKQSFEYAIKIDENSPWSKLAKDALSLL